MKPGLLILLIIHSIVDPHPVFAQKHSSNPNPGLYANQAVMPYHRIIQSAGKVITFGDSSLENHALDVCALPGKNFLAVEDRYGIAVLNSRTQSIVARWQFPMLPEVANLKSTYSGITSFEFDHQTYIAWGAAGAGRISSALMLATWTGTSIDSVTYIPFEKQAPADLALPNQVVARQENGELYLYVVLNGNNQLVKLRFRDRQVQWTASTGVAPFGVAVTNDKAYVTNWAGPQVTDTLHETAGTPWGSAYTDPRTGATRLGSLSVLDIRDGKFISDIPLGLHPNAIIQSRDDQYLFIANGNSDNVMVVDGKKGRVIDSIFTGLFASNALFGSSPNALAIDNNSRQLYVANGMDNAIAVIQLPDYAMGAATTPAVKGFIPTEAYPAGIVLINGQLIVANLEARGAAVKSSSELKRPDGSVPAAYTIHKELASVSIIPVPGKRKLNRYTRDVQALNLYSRIATLNAPPRKDATPKPLPERIGEPSVFKHVVYIIKENKTYDQVFGDIPSGKGDKNLCIYGQQVTPNQHQLASVFSLMDNYYASGKSSAEGHQWTDAASVSDYVQKNVRAWFRSYPHRQEDALVYNRNGFIWNNALDHGKSVKVYGEACTTRYNEKLSWTDLYNIFLHKDSAAWHNTTTIGRLKPIISADFPDCDNINFPDQLRADVFIRDWKQYEDLAGDQLPHLMVLSLPNDHTAGTSERFPTPRAMVADNDLAVGRIIETITHSRFWDSTVVFITEDDSQSGWDHISPYRTTGFVISPYSVFNKTISTNYNQVSLVRTIEQILGIPPMNIMDATALPMFDLFSENKTSVRYTCLPNIIPLNEMNRPVAELTGKAKQYAKLSSTQAFKEIDNGNDDLMNRILWFDARGEEAYPTR